jgi:putative ABC transport system permease protein
MVDQYLVDRYFRAKDPIGQQIRRGGANSPAFTIVGVVGTINGIDLGQPVTKERLYYPVPQQPRPELAIVLKTSRDPATLVTSLRTVVQALDPEQPIASVRTMDEWVSRSLGARRAPALLLSIFGAVAVLLAAIGIYGVLAFGVAQRVREIGIRQALGADRRAIVGLVLGQGVRMAGAGVALGLAGAFGLSRYLESQLFGVGARDLSVFAGAAALLLLIALAACYIPARRTTRIDPIAALREG